MKVELLDSHGSDNAIANAARVSFADFDNWNDIPDGYSDKRRNGLIKYLADHRHLTPFRHTSVSIRCQAPIFIARQLGKHQAGLSWNEESRRYIKKEPEFFVPDEWRAAPDGSIKQGSAGVHKDSAFWEGAYSNMYHSALDLYNAMLADGVAPEQARMVLPQSMLTNWVWTGNILAFAHVYKERIAAGAQKEAQDFAKALDSVIRPLFPIAWEALVGKSPHDIDFNKSYEG